MLKDKWFRIGLIGAVLGGLCCFTPLAVLAVTAAGPRAGTMGGDANAFPILFNGMGLIITSINRLPQKKG